MDAYLIERPSGMRLGTEAVALGVMTFSSATVRVNELLRANHKEQQALSIRQACHTLAPKEQHFLDAPRRTFI